MPTSVVHIRQSYDVYIGRSMPQRGLISTGWGNPFHIGPDSREEVIEKFRRWILGQPQLLARLPELKGKRLGCWCKPLACHGDVLAELADEEGAK